MQDLQTTIKATVGGLLPKTLTTSVGLSLPAGTSFDEWAALGVQIGKMHSASRWFVADWANQGEDLFGEEKTHAAIASAFDIEPKTLSNWRSIAWAVPMEARRGDVSFSHHAEVVSLAGEEQARFLELAATEKLSVVALREAIKQPAPLPPMVPAPAIDAFEGEETADDDDDGDDLSPEAQAEINRILDNGFDEPRTAASASSEAALTHEQAYKWIGEISQRLTAHERVHFSDIEAVERGYGRGKNDALRSHWAHVETCAENLAENRRIVWGDDFYFDIKTPNGDTYSVDYWPNEGEYGKFEYRGSIGPLTQNGYYCVFLREGERESAANPQSWATVHAAQQCRVAQNPKPAAPTALAQTAAPVAPAPAPVKAPPPPQVQLMWHGPIHRTMHEFTGTDGRKHSTTYEILQQVGNKGPEFMVIHNGKDEPEIPTKKTLNDAMKAVEQQAHVMLVRSQEVAP